jgi:hypothetical protein
MQYDLEDTRNIAISAGVDLCLNSLPDIHRGSITHNMMLEIGTLIFKKNLEESLKFLNNLVHDISSHCVSTSQFTYKMNWRDYFTGNVYHHIVIDFILYQRQIPSVISCAGLVEYMKNIAIQILEIFYDDDIKSINQMEDHYNIYPHNPLISVARYIKNSVVYKEKHIDKSNYMEGGYGGSVNNKRNVFKNGKIRSISKRVRRGRRKQTRQAN